MCTDKEGSTVKIIDFGAAKILDPQKKVLIFNLLMTKLLWYKSMKMPLYCKVSPKIWRKWNKLLTGYSFKLIEFFLIFAWLNCIHCIFLKVWNNLILTTSSVNILQYSIIIFPDASYVWNSRVFISWGCQLWWYCYSNRLALKHFTY